MALTFSANTGTATYKASVKRAGRKVKSFQRLQLWAAKKRRTTWSVPRRKEQ